MKVTVSRQELTAALLFISTDETRFVITGIQIEAKPGKPPLIVATDGRRLVAIESIAIQEESEHEGKFILRSEFVRPIVALTKAFGGKEFPWITIELITGSPLVSISHVGGFFKFHCRENALIDAEFPNWRQCVPAKSKKRNPVTDLALNAEFIGDFAKAAKLLGANAPLIQMSLIGNENQVEVVIQGVAAFYGLIMQCKADQETEYQPEFLSIVENFKKPTEEEEE